MFPITDVRLENALGELTRCRASLRNRLTAALDMAANVVLEQRPPFCGTFLRVHQLLMQLSHEVHSYFEMEEGSLPLRRALDGHVPARESNRLPYMLHCGQMALSALFAELGDVTEGFQAPPEGGRSYGALMDLLREIRMGLILQFRFEEYEIFPKLTPSAGGVLHAGSETVWTTSPPQAADVRKECKPN